MTKRIVLCADDYGQAPPISRGIITLLGMGRLTATSCMVNTPYWQEHAAWLQPYRAQTDIGLHFNLTEGQALSQAYRERYGKNFSSLPTLLGKAFFRQLDQAVIEAECTAQLQQFEQALGQVPDYIDGHQHVHQFPIIRQAIIAVYQRHLSQHASYVRLVKTPINNLKALIIYATGTHAFQQLLQRYAIPHNHSFAGIYAFAKSNRYADIFPDFLRALDEKGILMCHPALAGASGEDAIAAARYHEYQYLSGNQFLSDCGKYDIVLSRFNKLL